MWVYYDYREEKHTECVAQINWSWVSGPAMYSGKGFLSTNGQNGASDSWDF